MNTKEYKEMPYAASSQICIQMICRDWKAYYLGMKAYKKNPASMPGRPRVPAYYDKELGRNWVVVAGQNVKRKEDGSLLLPRFLDGLQIKSPHEYIKQFAVNTTKRKIKNTDSL